MQNALGILPNATNNVIVIIQWGAVRMTSLWHHEGMGWLCVEADAKKGKKSGSRAEEVGNSCCEFMSQTRYHGGIKRWPT
jgi:hypothetical protein